MNQLPYDPGKIIGVEAALIGACIEHPDRTKKWPSSSPEAFFKEHHRLIWQSMLDLMELSPPRSSDPRPDTGPGLGADSPRLFDTCRDCGAGSCERYGRRVLCLRCVQARERGMRARGGSAR